MDLRNHPDSVAIEHGERFNFLCVWRHPRDGDFSPLWNVVMDARTHTANLFDKLDDIRADARLADSAKAEDSKEAARRALADLGEDQRRLNKISGNVDAERLKLAGVPQADAGQAVVDVALAQFFRELNPADREKTLAELVAGSEPRVVDAMLRLPAMLFGITPKIRDVIEANAIVRRNPDEARHLQQMGEAMRTAQLCVSKCVQLVNENTLLTLEERMVSLGDGAWQPHVKEGAPDAMAALARRYGLSAH